MSLEVERVADDGLFMPPPVGQWSEEKLRVVWFYDRIFSTGMKNRWRRTYIDLFAGAGYSQLQGSKDIIRGSAVLAMEVPDPFDKYILCERSPKSFRALETRVNRDYPDLDVALVPGDCNDNVDTIAGIVRESLAQRGNLTFCFVDPYGLRFRFQSIQRLADVCGRIDFLVLLALGMDARRNEQRYVDGESRVVDHLLDDRNWRNQWRLEDERGVDFRRFVAERFVAKMISIGYMAAPVPQMKQFTTQDETLPLYHLAFFSKNPKGYDFWNETVKYASNQKSLPLSE